MSKLTPADIAELRNLIRARVAGIIWPRDGKNSDSIEQVLQTYVIAGTTPGELSAWLDERDRNDVEFRKMLVAAAPGAAEIAKRLTAPVDRAEWRGAVDRFAAFDSNGQ